jgi:hypothetical protein
MRSQRPKIPNWVFLLFWVSMLIPVTWILNWLATPSQIAHNAQLALLAGQFRFWSTCMIFASLAGVAVFVAYVNWRRR